MTREFGRRRRRCSQLVSCISDPFQSPPKRLSRRDGGEMPKTDVIDVVCLPWGGMDGFLPALVLFCKVRRYEEGTSDFLDSVGPSEVVYARSHSAVMAD